MDFTFEYKISIDVCLPRKEADVIFKCMHNHPDIKQYTTQGNFGFSFVNFYKDKDVERCFSISEIDKMSKALEIPKFILTDEEDELRYVIIHKIDNWVKSINEEYKRIYKHEKI